ncbi:hypothetical protein E4U21_000033 [Claviceps maximensis]|nr:hypothetical protein E4U21_000033 [Claviceps maximensis]
MDALRPAESPPPTALSKKQLRHEKNKPKPRSRNSSTSQDTPPSTAPRIQDAELSAFERVKKLKHFERFNGDIENRLTELIDKVLAAGEESVEPRPERRDELAALMLWHAEFHALALARRRERGDDDKAGSMEMRTLISELRGCFDRVTCADRAGRDTERAPYDALIKVYSMKKKQKESRRRRSQEMED